LPLKVFITLAEFSAKSNTLENSREVLADNHRVDEGYPSFLKLLKKCYMQPWCKKLLQKLQNSFIKPRYEQFCKSCKFFSGSAL